VRKLRVFLKYWLPVLLWMTLIFSASGDTKSFARSSRILGPLLHWLFPHLPEDTVNLIVFFARKGAHLTEYAVLALLLWRALRQPVEKDPRPPAWPEPPPTTQAEPQPGRMPECESGTLRRGEGPWNWRDVRFVLLLVALYAASDELHQLFVANRDSNVHDVLIDTTGGAAGLFALWRWGRWRKHW
jgi:VanZ family protein